MLDLRLSRDGENRKIRIFSHAGKLTVPREREEMEGKEMTERESRRTGGRKSGT